MALPLQTQVAGRLLPRKVLICSVYKVSQKCDFSATLHFLLQVFLSVEDISSTNHTQGLQEL